MDGKSSERKRNEDWLQNFLQKGLPSLDKFHKPNSPTKKIPSKISILFIPFDKLDDFGGEQGEVKNIRNWFLAVYL